MKTVLFSVFLTFCFFNFMALADEKVIHIYQDADLSTHTESAVAIQRGIEVAFAEIGNTIEGYKVLFKYRDHRGNVIRSKRNYQTFLKDPKALVIFSGIHSPPLIKNLSFINENKALTLVPWAAGGTITRYSSGKNWIYRLSIDDTKAGRVIVDYAMQNQKCNNPHLLLEDTPWGESNLKSMSKALKTYDISTPEVTRFSWNLKDKGANIIINNIIREKNDCLILVSNVVEGVVIVKEMLTFSDSQRLPIISHWGITGGDFHEKINATQRRNVNLNFIQTCFAFTNENQSMLAKKVFNQLSDYSNHTIKSPKDLRSAVGFIHAYDLTKILIQAIKQTGLTGNMLIDREAIRLALENITKPVDGLIKTYNKPFSKFDSVNNIDAHEALDIDDYCMGYYGLNDEILLSNE